MCRHFLPSVAHSCSCMELGCVQTPVLCTTHTHTRPFNGPLSGWAGTRKVKPICILLKQETVNGSGISCAICKSASRSRETMPAPHHSVFYRPDALPAAQPTASKHCTKRYKLEQTLFKVKSDSFEDALVTLPFCSAVKNSFDNKQQR